MTLSYESLPLAGADGQRLIVYLAGPGTADHDAMVLLDMLATGQETGARGQRPQSHRGCDQERLEHLQEQNIAVNSKQLEPCHVGHGRKYKQRRGRVRGNEPRSTPRREQPQRNRDNEEDINDADADIAKRKVVGDPPVEREEQRKEQLVFETARYEA